MSGIETLYMRGNGSLSWTAGPAKITGDNAGGLAIISAANQGISISAGSSIFFDTNGSQSMMITPDGKVGIGTNDPGATLDLGTGGMCAAYDTNTASYFGRMAIGNAGHHDYAAIAHIDCNNATDYALLQGTGGNTVLNSKFGTDIKFKISNVITMTLDKDNNVGIGITDPVHDLDVVGTAGLTTGTAWTNTSDDRIKYNETLISGTSALASINLLNPQTYEKIIKTPEGASGTWMPTDAEWPSVKDNYVWHNEIGVIAQNVRTIPGLSPAITGQEVDAEGTQTPLWINWDYIHNYHIAATKELSGQLEIEKIKVATLETELAAIKTHLGI